MAEEGRLVTGKLSTVLRTEWTIQEFSSLIGKTFVSPAFSVDGSTFCLKVYPDDITHFVSFHLCMIDSEPVEKYLKFHLSLKTIGEWSSVHTFTKLEPSDGIRNFCHWSYLLSKTEAGVFTLICSVEVKSLTPEVPKQDPQPMRRLVELDSLSSDFKNMLSGEMKWDITVIVQGKEFRAHRAVLSARSPVFRAMYEHETSEDQTGVLPITDCDPNTFGDFLNFLYTGKLDEVSFSTAYNLYETAEKYDVQQLKTFCSAYLMENLSPENVGDVVILSDKFGDDGLMSSAQEFFNKNFLKVFETSEWTTFMKNNYRLADKLLKGLASASTKND